jgi:hypothetical protein
MSRIVQLCICLLMIGWACGTSNPVTNLYTNEDKTVFELIEKLRKDPKDKNSQDLLPDAYHAARNKRQEVIDELKQSNAPGDKYIYIANELTVLQQMYVAITGLPVAKAIVPDVWDPSSSIQRARMLAAADYYEAGMVFLGYNTREYAQMAFNNFEKASKASPGFRDVDQMLLVAAEKATVRVLVNPVNYYRNSWNYYGFQNDFLQQQMVRDLNARSFRNIRFYTDWELNSRQMVPDKLVDLVFSELFIDQVHAETRTYQRTKRIETGQTKSIPAKPIYTTVYATVTIKRRYMSSYATLECRIYDRLNNNNIFFDRFPDRYDWKQEVAQYTGDRRALTQEDILLLSNRYDDYSPGRNEIADRLVRNCYQLLLSRIQSGVSF